MFFLLVSVFLCILLYHQYYDFKFKLKFADFYKTPTLSALPFIGNMLSFTQKNYLLAYLGFAKSKGLPCIVHTPNPNYITNVPDEIKIILHHPKATEKVPEYHKLLHKIIGRSLLLAPLEVWKKHRRLLSKGFSQGVLDSYVSTFYEKTETLVALIKNKDYNDSNIFYLFQKLTLDVFTETTLGVKERILEAKQHDFVDSITTGQRKVMERIGNAVKMNDFLYFRLPDGKLALKCKDHMFDFVGNIIKKKKTVHTPKDLIRESNRIPILELILENADKEGFDDDYIKREMTFFASAATDTTAYTSVYTLLLLGMHPEIQEKLYDEIIRIVGKDGEITYRNLVDFKYLDMVVNESMRIAPVVSLVARKATDDIDLGTKVIPNGSTITVFILAVHRDAKLYPNPLKFDPDRFLPEEVEKRHPYSFIPFSGGMKNCIGWKYAIMIVKVAVANIVRNLHISTKHKSLDEINFESHVVMSPTHPLDIHFTPRN